MGRTGQRGDAVRMYLTGAGADGGAQADPDLSLGGFRSSSGCGSMEIVLVNALAGLRVEYAAGANGAGEGTLTAMGPDQLAWKAPGDTTGPTVTVLVGGVAILESASDPARFLRVRRMDIAAMSGACTVQLYRKFNGALAQANAAVESGKTYRCVCLRAESAMVTGLKVWLGEGIENVKIGLEAPTAGEFSTIANEATAPAGVVLVAPDSAEHVDVLDAGDLRPGEMVGLWIERDAPVGGDASGQIAAGVAWSFTAIG